MRLSALPKLVVAVVLPLLALCADRPARAQAPGASAPAAAPATASLQREIAALTGWVEKHGGQVGVAVVDVDSGRLLGSARENVAVNPASNAKVLTAAAAFARLGPDFRFTTGLHGRLRDGRTGDLVLRGHGDPSLTARDLSAMCRSLVAMGLKRVDGKILVDQSRFDDQFVPPAFGQQPDEWAAFRAPVSAVALDRNTVTLNVMAGKADAPARTWFHPPGFVISSGSVGTRAQGSGQAVALSLRPDGQRLRATLGGHLAVGLPRLRFARRVDDPRLMPGYVLAHMLRGMGVEVGQEVALGGQGVRARLVFHRSDPLAVLLGQLGKHSDNFYAEMILKALGAEVKGAPATSAAGAQVVADWLRQVGAADAGTVVKNGSGLFDANRTSPLTLARALRVAHRDPATRAEFVSHLAVGGVDGTLRSRFRRHRQTRRVRGKTGTLATVDALSGYVLGEPGQGTIAFSIVVTGIRDHRQVRRRIDRVVERLLNGSS